MIHKAISVPDFLTLVFNMRCKFWILEFRSFSRNFFHCFLPSIVIIYRIADLMSVFFVATHLIALSKRTLSFAQFQHENGL